ncbi:MAG TPA: tRNA preQ1(34) S-adenosylmethionine ribosyltransferase-isomerase QueA [bacterium]|nr:tRNA preQ1(34) S-adenosylmethionine ribosyltransferase-isomerase QueA [bacterium]
METTQFDYDLPQELIAQDPLANRENSRLMVLNRKEQSIEHRTFKDITEYLGAGDLLVLNDSRVFPARLFVRKKTGANIELFFLEPIDRDKGLWKVLARPGRRISVGMELVHDEANPFCRVVEKHDKGIWTIEIISVQLMDFLQKYGIIPLPPYIKKKLDNAERYQTVYAEKPGSSAAPTAGLHFTEQLMKEVENRGAKFEKVTLHIGIDTFRPISTEYIEDHQMHSEWYSVSDSSAEAVYDTKTAGGRVIAVGTTSVRTLESWAAGISEPPYIRPEGNSGDTNLFIFENSQFRVIDSMVTNFHLPRSTLLTLVSAFAGRDFIRRAYREAIDREYRFFSFGDAMLIL